MRRLRRRMRGTTAAVFLAGLALLLGAAGTQAATARGTVINRTTGKPGANLEVVLLDLQGGMAEVAKTKTDAQGQFTFNSDAIGKGPMLLRTEFQGVTYNAPLPPGRAEGTLEIFDVSKDPRTISVASHVVILEPNGGKLIGAEEYVVTNNSSPAVAHFRAEGDFEFAIPEKGNLQQVSTTGTSGMSVQQAPIDKGKGVFGIAYGFRPGPTRVRLSYELPYDGTGATLKLPAMVGGVKMLVVAPPGVTLEGDGLQAAGQQQGMMVYTHEPLAAKSGLTVKVSGTGALPSADGGSDQGQSQETPQEGNSRQGGPQVQAVPGRLDDYKWYLFGGLGGLFAMGAILLTKKQITVMPTGEAVTEPATPAPGRAAAKASAAVDDHVAANMESLKDAIFRLELRRQAGTISEEEYAQEKARMDQRLRELVKG